MARLHMGLGTAALMLGLASAAQAAPPTSTAPASSPGTAIAIMQADAALQSSDCAAALGPLNQLWDDPYLQNSDPDLAAEMRLRLIACTAEKSSLAEALTLSTENISRPGSGLAAYDMQAFLLLAGNQPAAAADALDAAMTRFPGDAPNLSDMTVFGTLALLHDSAPARELALLDHAEQVRWQTHILSARSELGLMRIEGLRAAVAAGHDDLAALYRTDLKTDAFSYIVSQGDGLATPPDAVPDPVEPIIAAQIKEAQAAIVKSPNDLMTLVYLMNLERADGQNDTALTQLNGILALVDQYGLQNFQNPELYGELLGIRGQLLSAMGRQADALVAFKDGETRLANLPAGDFYADYAGYLVASGDDKGAIALIDRIDVASFSDSEKASLITTDACAFGHIGDAGNYAAFVGVLGDPLMRVHPHLCAGDADKAAADLIAGMAAPDDRAGAVLMMQATAQAVPASDSDRAALTAVAALRTRADVMTAADAAKIVSRSWPLQY